MRSGGRKGLRRERVDGRQTVGDVVRRLVGRPPTLLRILAVGIPLSVVGVVFTPAPFQFAPVALIGVPVMAWMMRQDWNGSPPPPNCDATEDS